MDYTRPATWEDVRTLVRLLEENGVSYALVGGYALAVHGYARFTEDVDILVDSSVENARRWILALSKLPDGAARELLAEPDVFARQQRYAVRINDEFTVDVLPAVAGLGWDDLKSHVVSMQVEGEPVRVLDLPGLLRSKQTPRAKDQVDAEIIAEVIRRQQAGQD
jgi:hypothetical protein